MNNLRRLRKGQGLAMRELSVISGISTATLVAIERYGYLPGPDTREKITKALGISQATIWPSVEVVSDGN